MQITTLEMEATEDQALALAVVCRAVGCRTLEELRGDVLVLHIVGPDSTLEVLKPLLPRFARVLPTGSRSEIFGYAVTVGSRLSEHIMIPDGASDVVEAEFRDRFTIYTEQPRVDLDASDYEAGGRAGQEFPLFPMPLPRGESHG